MTSFTFIVIVCCLITIAINRAISVRRNHQIAKRTGFPVVLSPVDITEIWWLLSYRRLLPLFDSLPTVLVAWLPLAKRFHLWKLGYEPFEQLGSDTVVVSSPKGNLLQTCDPYIANQILSHHKTIQMNLDVTKIFNIWGPTVASTEGEEWRVHRKIVMAGLGPQSNALVWDQAVKDTTRLISLWKEQDFVVEYIKPWTSKLALHITSATFFGQQLPWTKQDQQDLSKPHRLTFEEALIGTISKIRLIFMIPKPLLERLPMQSAKAVRLAINELTMYMKEMRQEILATNNETSKKSKLNLLESIVLGFENLDDIEKEKLPEDYALGDIFFTLLAGHETIGNTLAFTLLLLCVYPEWQDRIYQQISTLNSKNSNSGSDESTWDYHDNYTKLQEGPMGAVINETLRLYNVVQMVWRKVTTETPITASNSTTYNLPAGMLCMINFSAAHRNPSNWPPKANFNSGYRNALNDSPAIDFDPEHWLTNTNTTSNEKKPLPTSWPFSQGVRSCPGRGFAFVEMTAVLSTLLKDYSLELLVNQGEEENSDDDNEARKIAARDEALRMLVDGVQQVNLNIEMVEKLPIRLVPRK